MVIDHNPAERIALSPRDEQHRIDTVTDSDEPLPRAFSQRVEGLFQVLTATAMWGWPWPVARLEGILRPMDESKGRA